MWAENPRMVDLDPTQWLNLVNLFDQKKPKPKKGTLYLLLDEGRVVKCVHSRKGRLSPEGRVENRKSLKLFKEKYDVRRVFALQKDAIPRIAHFFQKGLAMDMDYGLQWLTLLQVIGKERNRSILTYPSSPNWFRLSSPRWLDRLYRFVFPKEGSVCIMVFEDHRPYASCILGIQNHDIELITTIAFFGDSYLPPTPWQDGYKEILAKIKEKHSPCFFGFFAERGAIEALMRKQTSFPQLLKERQAIVDPLPLSFKPFLRFL